jgi:enoyl-CoA hydratase/carnithine racemase
MSDPLLIEKHFDNQVWVLTLNRPEQLNALSSELATLLTQAFEDYRDDPVARVAILTGSGRRAFCSGADLKEQAERRRANLAAGRPVIDPARIRKFRLTPLSEGLGLWKPTIAAINGLAIAGGFMLAMQCDIRLMAEDAYVSIAEARWNMGGAGWMAPLTRQIGLGNALELALWGDTEMSARRMYEMGWVQRVVPPDELLPLALEYGNRMIDLAPRAVSNIKQMLYRGFNMDPTTALEHAGWLEQNLAGMADSMEGPLAFSEKRRPKFTGQ